MNETSQFIPPRKPELPDVGSFTKAPACGLESLGHGFQDGVDGTPTTVDFATPFNI